MIDFQTRFAPVASTLAGATAHGVLWQAAPGRFLLAVPEVARYLVSNGASITIDSAADACDEEVTRFLRLTPLAALFFQRGSLAFHAAAVSLPFPPRQNNGRADETGALLIAGDSGVGKSTLLAALIARGWRLLADDLAVVEMAGNGQLVVLPAFQEIILWPDAVEKLGLGATTNKAFPNSSGLTVLTARLAGAPQTLRAIYWLSVHHKDEIEMNEKKGADRFQAIGTLTYNSHIADALLDHAAYLRLASAIALAIPLYRLRRPRGRWSVEELADKIVMASEALPFSQADNSPR